MILSNVVDLGEDSIFRLKNSQILITVTDESSSKAD